MAGFNEILVGRFARALQKLTGIKGSPPTATLSGDLQPSLDLNSIPVEDRYLLSQDQFGAAIGLAGVAAQNSAVRIRNLPTSNMVASVEFITIVVNLADSAIQIGRISGGAALGAEQSGLQMDKRGRPNSSLLLSVGNNVLNVNVFYQLAAQANTSRDLIVTPNQELVILPGDGITVSTTTVNVQLIVSVKWRERFLEESERS